MTITTLAGLQAAYPGRRYVFAKSIAVASPTYFASSWIQSGNPVAGSVPPTGAGEVPTNATTGAFPLVAPATGNTLYLVRARCWSQAASAPATVAAMVLADRLVHTSGLSGTVTTAQTVNSVSVNRGPVADAHAYLEIYTTLGGTNSTATVSYTNQSGVAGQTGTASIVGSQNTFTSLMLPIQLASGDTGVQSVESVTLSASTGTAGNFGITIIRTIAWIPMASGIPFQQDYLELGLPSISSNACLFAVNNDVNQPYVGDCVIVEG